MLYNLVVLLTLSFGNNFPMGETVVWGVCVKGRYIFIPLAGVWEIWWVVACDVVALINVCLHCGLSDAEGALSTIKCFFQGFCLDLDMLARCPIGWGYDILRTTTIFSASSHCFSWV